MSNAQELKRAKLALEVAQNNFDCAEPDFIDSSTYQLTAAISRFDAVYTRLKKVCPEGLTKPANGGRPC